MYTREALRRILAEVRGRRISTARALRRLKDLPYESFSFARVDHHRFFRKGFPEAVYAPGKSFSQLVRILRAHARSGQAILVTRLEPEIWSRLAPRFPFLRYSAEARIACSAKKIRPKGRPVAVLTAGTGDIPAAEEAALTLERIGRPVRRIYDCGAAGMHRLLDALPGLRRAGCIICVAGMDGVLPSLTAGLVDRPVVAVPTSVGYGASFRGIAPLLTMLNACAQGVAVVNIDNGFGAACFAALCTA